MKARLVALMLALASMAAGVHAHPGGLNAEGCHNDRKNGGYHCHRAPTPTPARSRAPAAAGVSSGAAQPTAPSQRAAPAGERPVYYPNCAAARAAGVAPIRRGSPGYAAHLDRDNDGIACE